MGLFKKILLALGILVAFYVGYASTAEAWPGVPDRDRWYGYFKNVRQTFGDDVMLGGLPGWVNNADTFISFIKGKLNEGTWTANGVGAAFIIQTMIGLDRSLPPNGGQIAEWEQRVRYAESRGWISWNTWVNYTVNSYYQPGPVDDAFYYENGAGSAVVFRDAGGGVAYMIRRECVNPIGNLAAIPDNPNYNITGSTSVNDTTAMPGQTVAFTHNLRNSGPDWASIGWTTRDASNGAGIASGSTGLNGNNAPVLVNTQNFTVPINAAFGTQYCRYITFAPASNGTGSGQGNTACTQVVADYELTPIVDSNGVSAAQQNDLITFTYKVANSGPTRSQNITCKPVGGTKPPGYSPQGASDTDRNADAGFVAPSTSCPLEVPVGATPTTVANEVVDVGNAAPGTRICRSLVINPKNENGGFRSSSETCVVIAKTPYVHFMGNDVWAGGGFEAVNAACNANSKIRTTSHGLRDGSAAGSAVEYAAFALGKITDFGSANKALTTTAGVAGKVLTFSNFDSSNLGFYGAPRRCINDYIDRYSSIQLTAEPNPINVGARGSGQWRTAGNYQLSGNLAAGVQQIYLIEGDVTITGNITYPSTYSSLTDIPSLVVIATGNITVQDNVTQMDGLFVNRGTFATCNPPAGNLSVSICNNQLVINGAVVTGKLDLLRTAGADGANDSERKRPAELFNFNSELYLRNAISGSNNNILKTIDQKDLPPRF